MSGEEILSAQRILPCKILREKRNEEKRGKQHPDDNGGFIACSEHDTRIDLQNDSGDQKSALWYVSVHFEDLLYSYQTSMSLAHME